MPSLPRKNEDTVLEKYRSYQAWRREEHGTSTKYRGYLDVLRSTVLETRFTNLDGARSTVFEPDAVEALVQVDGVLAGHHLDGKVGYK